jgi:hypothetical protein
MLLALALGAGGDPGEALVALKAGTIHVVNGAPLTNGTILVRGSRIVAVGVDVVVPANARVVDYGPDAVITPGLVAADSTIGRVVASDRSADPTLLAIDQFEPETSYVFALQEGITSSYIAPARRRLIAGQGAVVKLAGKDETRRVLSASSMIHGAISAEARSTPGYWKPPVPAVIDIGLGYEKPQLPRTLMGAMVALRELVEQANGAPANGEFGPEAAPALRELMRQGLPWRIAADNAEEAAALLCSADEAARDHRWRSGHQRSGDADRQGRRQRDRRCTDQHRGHGARHGQGPGRAVAGVRRRGRAREGRRAICHHHAKHGTCVHLALCGSGRLARRAEGSGGAEGGDALGCADPWRGESGRLDRSGQGRGLCGLRRFSPERFGQRARHLG